MRTEKNQRRFAPTKTGRLAPEWVAAFLRNQWPESAEYAAVAYKLARLVYSMLKHGMAYVDVILLYNTRWA